MAAPLEAGAPWDRPALLAELERFHSASFGWALHCCRWDRDEAEELLQVVYLEVLEGRARFGGRSTVRTWLFAVIRRMAAARRRRRWLKALAFDRWAAVRPRERPGADQHALLEQSEEAAVLRRALATLSRRQGELLHLVFYEGLTIQEAAGMLDVSEGTARTHYERAKALLRRRLAEARP